MRWSGSEIPRLRSKSMLSPRGGREVEVTCTSCLLAQTGQPGTSLFKAPLAGSALHGLGATWLAEYSGVNFTLASKEATKVSLCLFKPDDLRKGKSTAEIPLDAVTNRTGTLIPSPHKPHHPPWPPSGGADIEPLQTHTRCAAGDTWHVLVPNINKDLLYAFRVEGPEDNTSRFVKDQCVVDPYAAHVVSRGAWGEMGADLDYGEGALGLANTWPQHVARLPEGSDGRAAFDWEGDRPLMLPMEDISVYEMHVRGFTKHASSGLPDNERGSFIGAAKKLQHVADMGFTAVELMPAQEFNELEYYTLIPGSDSKYRFNYWGYSTVGFFSPMSRFSADPSRALDEFRVFVKESHRLGMEVYLDVVFNHTAEGNHQGPTLSFRGIDNKVFYMLAPEGEYYNFSGCGNTVNCNHPGTRRFIVDCLKWWVSEMHVDGFRFDLASIMTRQHSSWHQTAVGTTKPAGPGDGGMLPESSGVNIHVGTPLSDPPLIRMISEDPVLRNTKMIAEAWDCGGLVQVGAFPHYDGRWSEWNGKFRDTVRSFIKGSDGFVSKMASAVLGSPDIYKDNHEDPDDWWRTHGGRRWVGNRGPTASVNFVTAHDGFTMRDLVSYNSKNNMANGENNNDGEEHNISWNCGQEGETQDPAVNSLRARQMRNMVVALGASQGVPMMLMGDEYGHTKGGNNNTYCHDDELNWFDWDKCEEQRSGMVHFTAAMMHIRRAHKAFRRSAYPGEDAVKWHGAGGEGPNWDETARLLAFSLKDEKCEHAVFVAFNASHKPVNLDLPDPGHGNKWRVLVDTSKPAPYDALIPDVGYNLSSQAVAAARAQTEPWLSEKLYAMLPYSSIILENTGCATTVDASL